MLKQGLVQERNQQRTSFWLLTLAQTRSMMS